MLAAINETVVTAIAGIAVALITGGFAFAGVLVNVRSQQQPVAVEVSEDELDRLNARVAELEADVEYLRDDRDWWRDMAKRWAPQRRRDDRGDDVMFIPDDPRR